LGGGRAKAAREAYRGLYEMQRNARNLAIMAIALSIGISIFAPQDNESLEILTHFSGPLRAETSLSACT